MSFMTIIKKVTRKFVKSSYYIIRKLKLRYQPISTSDCYFRNFTPQCNFIYDIDKKEEYISKFKSISCKKEIIISANKICMHKFNLLGSCDKYLGKNLPWLEDFKSGYKWNNKFYKDIKLIDLYNDADVKVPWELSRFQHVFTLGKAYWLTDDEKYALEFKEEIEDWYKNNPVEMSVNWTCTMDVSIRAANWISGYFFFKGSASMDDVFWSKFNKYLYLHGRFIYKNLENEGQHNDNHYISDLTGLIWLGMYFGEFFVYDKERKNDPKNWLKFGIAEFESEMKKEVNDDGTDYESSTAYHRLVTEIFLITSIFCNKNDIYFTKEYIQKLERMCEFIMYITKPNGLASVIGDSDDGRLIILSNYGNWNRRDFTHILAVAGEYFNRDDFRYIGKNYKEDALWTMGSYKETNEETVLSSRAYEKGGYYILRNKRIYCIIGCGDILSREEGGHSHNDQLSFELNVDGEDFIIDPGNYVYTADYKMRNLYRSTRMHNTLCIDGYEQNDFNEYDLFHMKEQTFAKCKLFDEKTFWGKYYGYKEKCGVIHERKVNLSNDMLIIEDKLIGDHTNKNVYLNFILDYGVEIKGKDNGIELIKRGRNIFLDVGHVYSIEEAYVSYGYGEKLITKKISVLMKNNESKINLWW